MKKPIRMEDFEKMEKVEFPQKFMQRTITITKKKEMNISGLFLQQLRAVWQILRVHDLYGIISVFYSCL